MWVSNSEAVPGLETLNLVPRGTGQTVTAIKRVILDPKRAVGPSLLFFFTDQSIHKHTNKQTLFDEFFLTTPVQVHQQFAEIFGELLQGAYFRAARMKPSMLARVTFDVEHPDDDQILVVFTGAIVPLQAPPRSASPVTTDPLVASNSTIQQTLYPLFNR